jgi:hypothetical protein
MQRADGRSFLARAPSQEGTNGSHMALDAFLLALLHLPLSSVTSRGHLASIFRLSRWATTSTTVMPESSQPKTPSTLSQMTRVEPSDGPDSDSMVESLYHEDVQTVSIPTKSGTEVPIRPHHQSDNRPSTSGISSRPSSRCSELDRDDEEVIQKCSVLPSTAEFAIQTREFVKPLPESEPELSFAFGKRAPPSNASGNSQSTQSSQSSQAVPPTSFEKSNQEHQVSARSAHQEPSLAPISQGLGKLFSWLSSWLTLNIQAPVDLQKDVQAPGSPLFQNISGAQVQKAASTPHAQPRVPQSLGRSNMQGPKQLRRKKYALPLNLTVHTC